MGEMGDIFRDMREEKKERHNEWYENNLKTLLDYGLSFELKDTVCLFREKGGIKVDFYPHTGRWKFNNKIYAGGAKRFIAWYNKRVDKRRLNY